MSTRKSQANRLKKGSYFMDGEEPCRVLSNEHSKSGKHGHAKCRITAIGLFDEKKRSLTFPADTLMDVPEILKRTATVSYIEGEHVGLMDQETYESYDVTLPEDLEIQEKLLAAGEGSQVEIWDVVGKKMITRVFTER